MHTLYYNSHGEEVPSVTTILKIINKPELMSWSNWLGFKKEKLEDVLNRSSYFGTCIHDYLESYFGDSEYVHMYSTWCSREDYKKVLSNFDAFIKDKQYKALLLEKSLSCETYGGTLDYYGEFNNKKMIIDFKTSKKPYTTYFLQLGGYYNLLMDSGYDVDEAGILIINKKECYLKTIRKDELDMYRKIFLKLVDFYNAYSKVNTQ